MSIFRRLFGGLASRERGDDRNALWIFVRCSACGEAIKVRIDKVHDLTGEFDGQGDYPTRYHVSKEIVGQRCFRRLHVELTFDAQKRPVERQITGGEFITEAEYAAAAPAPPP